MKKSLTIFALALATAGWGCYGHAPMKTNKQLEAGEAAVSGQLRLPGYSIVPGIAGVGQVGFGAGDVNAQAGYGWTNVYGSLGARGYLGELVTLSTDATYVWLADEYDPQETSLVTLDFDDSFVVGFDALFRIVLEKSVVAIGPRLQGVWFVPDPAREDYVDEYPEADRETEFEGMTMGAVASASIDVGGGFWIQSDLMWLPFFVGPDSPGSWGFRVLYEAGSQTLGENVLQLGFGVTYHF